MILDSDANGLETVTQNYCKWFHSKIIFRIQMMVKKVIWLNLKIASVCTFQIWKICGSRVFYKFRGFHRLPIYDFWITREKDMNYLVLKCNLLYLNFTSIICTVTMWYYCIIVFYTLQGFHWYVIFNFWTYRRFSMHFTSFSTIWRDLNLF
jgi:hypothetical protein